MTVKFKGDSVQYLGDGVYASFDGYHIWLETSDGYIITNSIAIEQPVYQNLKKYAESIVEQ